LSKKNQTPISSLVRKSPHFSQKMRNSAIPFFSSQIKIMPTKSKFYETLLNLAKTFKG
jgi:hypothetical protein